MTKIVFEGEALDCPQGLTLLDSLLRQGHAIPHGCRAGACQSCLVRLETGVVAEAAQANLSRAARDKGLLLACQCYPEQELTISKVDPASLRTPATLIGKQQLSDSVFLLRLSSPLSWQPGQHVNLWLPGLAQTRSYSIANLASEDAFVELHVRRYADGYLSRHLIDNTEIGDRLQLQGPLGEFGHHRERVEDSYLMLAEGTGLAPLIAIGRAVSQAEPTSRITFLCTSRSANYYGKGILASLQRRLPHWDYQVFPTADQGQAYSPLIEALGQRFALRRGHNVYICGSAAFVAAMRRASFLAGAASRQLSWETFVDFNSAP